MPQAKQLIERLMEIQNDNDYSKLFPLFVRVKTS